MTRPINESPTGACIGRAQGNDFAAGMDAVGFAQRHQKDEVVPEAYDFGERAAVVTGGFDATDFADGHERAFRFNDQPDDLSYKATVLDYARRANASGADARGGWRGWR